MKTFIFSATALLFTSIFLSSTVSADCVETIDPDAERIQVVEDRQLRWCWPALAGGTGNVTYVVESSTNSSEWVVEVETDLLEWSVTRNVGDSVEMRYFACDDIGCTDYSEASREVTVLPNFDLYADGLINGLDFFMFFRASGSATGAEAFAQFRSVVGTVLVDGVYIP